MKTTENNKLIAEFDGFSIEEMNGNEYATHPDMLEALCVEEELQYHSSWDWLMPVIEKCLVGEAEQSEEISKTTIKNIYEGICNQDISFAYESVVEFIKQQNKNEK